MSDKHLCVECSMCCNGSIFGQLKVTKKEKKFLKNGEFFERNDKLFLRLGCNYLGSDGACQVYDSRPKTCAKYTCNLLKRFNKGEVSDSEAKLIVSDIKTLERTTIRLFAEAVAAEERKYDFTSAIDARDYFWKLEEKGVQIDEHKKVIAWLWLDLFVDMMRHEIEEYFLKG